MKIGIIRLITWSTTFLGLGLMIENGAIWPGSGILFRHVGALLCTASIWIQSLCEYKVGEITMVPTSVRKEKGGDFFIICLIAKMLYGSVFLFVFKNGN
jgi:hypothetical protein